MELMRPENKRPFFQCIKEDCRAKHGAHDNGTPFGIPGDLRTRKLRSEAHELFDRIWKSGKMKRGQAYAWATAVMGATEQVHIGALDAKGCKKLIDAVIKEFPDLCPLLSDL